MKKLQEASQPFKQAGVEIGKGRYHDEIVYGVALMYTALYNEIGTYLKKHNLTPGEMNVLMLVKHQGRDRGLSQVDMGRRLMVTAHNMTRLIQRLEKDDLIKRISYREDARVNLVKITPKGYKLLDQIWPAYDQRLQELAGKLSQQEQVSLAHLMQKWLNHAK